MVTVHPIDTIISDPNIKNGQPIIGGSQVRVLDVVASHLYRQLSPDALATNFNISLGQVYAALAYYYQNKAIIDNSLRENAKIAAQLQQELEAQGRVISLD